MKPEIATRLRHVGTITRPPPRRGAAATAVPGVGLAVVLALVAALAACGVDGPPQPPAPREAEAPQRGISLRGSVEAGAAGTTVRRDRHAVWDRTARDSLR